VDGRAGTGRQAEELAARALERGGMQIVARNWRRPEGELDLVARAPDGTCVFCEVRSRTGEGYGDPLEAVGPRKQARVIRAARLFLSEETIAATGYRFDVVAVTFYDGAVPPRVVHIAGAFEVTS
jgi:putative endonuclease